MAMRKAELMLAIRADDGGVKILVVAPCGVAVERSFDFSALFLRLKQERRASL